MSVSEKPPSNQEGRDWTGLTDSEEQGGWAEGRVVVTDGIGRRFSGEVRRAGWTDMLSP